MMVSTNSLTSSAREVVFDLFQDLDGFSLNDYKPFSDISSSMERLVDFLSMAIADRELHIIETNRQTFEIESLDGAKRIKFTLDRDVATSSENIELIGLDHPIVQEELGRWRSIPPEELGAALDGNGDGPALISLWLVETTNSTGEKCTLIQPIAVRPDGTRLPALERQVGVLMKRQPATPFLETGDRIKLFYKAVEPSLQRELRHKGTANDVGSYSADLVGYLEVV